MSAAKLPKEWTDYGASFGRDGLLYFAEWRRGFMRELRAMFWTCQQVTALKRDSKRIRRERDELANRVGRTQKESGVLAPPAGPRITSGHEPRLHHHRGNELA